MTNLKSLNYNGRTFNSSMLVVVSGTKLHLLFWTTCNAYNEHVHKQALEAIMKESVGAYEWLMDEPIELWARYTFPISIKCLDNTTNFVESFNGKIELFRYKPIFILLEEIKRKFTKTIANRFNVAKTWIGHVLPRVKVMLIKIELESSCIATPASRGVLKVLDGVLHSQ